MNDGIGTGRFCCNLLHLSLLCPSNAYRGGFIPWAIVGVSFSPIQGPNPWGQRFVDLWIQIQPTVFHLSPWCHLVLTGSHQDPLDPEVGAHVVWCGCRHVCIRSHSGIPLWTPMHGNSCYAATDAFSCFRVARCRSHSNLIDLAPPSSHLSTLLLLSPYCLGVEGVSALPSES